MIYGLKPYLLIEYTGNMLVSLLLIENFLTYSYFAFTLEISHVFGFLNGLPSKSVNVTDNLLIFTPYLIPSMFTQSSSTYALHLTDTSVSLFPAENNSPPTMNVVYNELFIFWKYVFPSSSMNLTNEDSSFPLL